MKIFVYKTIFVLVGVYVLYQFTIGKKIDYYEYKFKHLTNDQGRELIRNKVRDELIKATEKEQILDLKDREILKKFIIKIQSELSQ